MLLAQIAMLVFAGIPPTNPQLPQIVTLNSISATSNTTISNSVTLSSPKSVGYSAWLGNFKFLSSVLMTTAPSPGGGPSLPGIPIYGGVGAQ